DVDFGMPFNAHLGYQWNNGFGLEAGLGEMLRAATVNTNYASTDAFVILEYEAYIEPLYRFDLGPKSALIAGLQVGVSTAIVETDYLDGNASGGGLVLEPELRYQFLFGRRFGLNLGLFYRQASFNNLEYEGNAVTNANGSGKWLLNDSGLGARVAFDFYFKRLTR
ncbi:MAG: hypothetical protein ACREKE_00095, partial [bacterium]